MKLISKVTEIYCIADDFCKEYELELNKKHFRFQIPLQRPLKLAIEREEWAMQKWLPFLSCSTAIRFAISNFIVNLLAGMAAYAFYETKPSINMEFEMEGEAEVNQLTLF